MKRKENIFSLICIIILAVIARLLPHPPNFVPIGGLALFSGANFSGKKAYLIPISAMLISDLFLGFHSTMIFVYLSFLLMIIIGKTLREKFNLRNLFVASLISSITFFIITNFGVWLTMNFYSKDWQGLVNCYQMAIPFFRNTILGDLIYSFSFFYGYKFLNFIIIRFVAIPRS